MLKSHWFSEENTNNSTKESHRLKQSSHRGNVSQISFWCNMWCDKLSLKMQNLGKIRVRISPKKQTVIQYKAENLVSAWFAFLFVGVCNVLLVLFVFFASFKTLLIQMDFHQNIDKGFSCIHHIIKNLELEIDFILKDKFQNIPKKVHFLSNIAKFTSFYSWGPPLFVCDVILSWIQIFLVIGKQQREGRCVCVYLWLCVFVCVCVFIGVSACMAVSVCVWWYMGIWGCIQV